MSDILRELQKPFPVSQISWRIGATSRDKKTGIALAYIDARDVMFRLDDVFGPLWQAKYSHADKKTICEIGCKIDGEWVWRAGGAGDTDIEAEKGAISDAFKRAAVLWGIGRYLYDLPNEWVPLENEGRKLARTPNLPKWATPEGWDEPPKVVDPSRLQDMLQTIADCSTIEALAELKAQGLEAATQAKDETAYKAVRSAANKRAKDLGVPA